MSKEIEVTVKVLETQDNILNKLFNQGFKIIDQYSMIDIYMLPIDVDINKIDKYEVLNKCILLRNIDNRILLIVSKNKKYDNNGDIISQSKTECHVKDIREAKDLFEQLGYKQLFTIENKSTVVSNNKIELSIQDIKNQGIYIEIERQTYQNNYSDEEIINDLINIANSLNLKIGNNYFEKKALVELEKLSN